MHAIHVLQYGVQFFKLFDDGTRLGIDTTNKGDYPKFVADTHVAIISWIHVDGNCFATSQTFATWCVAIGQLTAQICGHVVGVDVFATGNVLLGTSNGRAILDDVLSLGNIHQGKLVAFGNALF